MAPNRDPDSLKKLKIVYGAMPANLTPEYSKTERYIKQLSVSESLTDAARCFVCRFVAISFCFFCFLFFCFFVA